MKDQKDQKSKELAEGAVPDRREKKCVGNLNELMLLNCRVGEDF